MPATAVRNPGTAVRKPEGPCAVRNSVPWASGRRASRSSSIALSVVRLGHLEPRPAGHQSARLEESLTEPVIRAPGCGLHSCGSGVPPEPWKRPGGRPRRRPVPGLSARTRSRTTQQAHSTRCRDQDRSDRPRPELPFTTKKADGRLELRGGAVRAPVRPHPWRATAPTNSPEEVLDDALVTRK
jgi:hypothetical protein